MILYEVRIAVDAELMTPYRAWLEAHIREMLSLPGFQFAELLREENEAGRAVFVAHYWLQDRDSLEAYLRDHAARFRAEGEAQFGGRFSASRRVLELDRRMGQR